MSWYRRFTRSLQKAVERSGRARVLAVLRGMDPRTLKDLGYSPELLRKGLSAWPWRLEEAAGTAKMPSSKQIRAAETELSSYSDAQLADLGIHRGAISDVVRNGRPGIDDIAA